MRRAGAGRDLGRRSGPAPARAQHIAALITDAHARGLAESPQWRALLHYQAGAFGGWKSGADGLGFFLAGKVGRTEPQAELDATISALLAPAPPLLVAPGHCRGGGPRPCAVPLPRALALVERSAGAAGPRHHRCGLSRLRAVAPHHRRPVRHAGLRHGLSEQPRLDVRAHVLSPLARDRRRKPAARLRDQLRGRRRHGQRAGLRGQGRDGGFRAAST